MGWRRRVGMRPVRGEARTCRLEPGSRTAGNRREAEALRDALRGRPRSDRRLRGPNPGRTATSVCPGASRCRPCARRGPGAARTPPPGTTGTSLTNGSSARPEVGPPVCGRTSANASTRCYPAVLVATTLRSRLAAVSIRLLRRFDSANRTRPAYRESGTARPRRGEGVRGGRRPEGGIARGFVITFFIDTSHLGGWRRCPESA